MVKIIILQTLKNPKTPAAQRFSALRYSEKANFTVAKHLKKLRYSEEWPLSRVEVAQKNLHRSEVKFTIAKLKSTE